MIKKTKLKIDSKYPPILFNVFFLLFVLYMINEGKGAGLGAFAVAYVFFIGIIIYIGFVCVRLFFVKGIKNKFISYLTYTLFLNIFIIIIQLKDIINSIFYYESFVIFFVGYPLLVVVGIYIIHFVQKVSNRYLTKR